MCINFELQFYGIIFRNADLVIGGQSRHSLRSKNFVDSEAYFQDDITWCVRHARVRATWKRFLYIFDLNVLWLSLVAVIPLIYIHYIAQGIELRPRDIWSSMLAFMSTISQQPFVHMPRHTSTRIIYSFFVHLTLPVLTTFMAVSITIIARINYEKQVSSFDQISDESFHLAAEENTKNYLIERKLVICSILPHTQDQDHSLDSFCVFSLVDSSYQMTKSKCSPLA